MPVSRALFFLAAVFAGFGALGAGVSCAGASAGRDGGADAGRGGDSATERSLADVAPDEGSRREASPRDAGPPSLTSLRVTGMASGDGGAPFALVPPFSPQVYDYYVLCGPGENHVTVQMAASKGASSRLLQPTKSPSSPKQTLSLDVSSNQAIVAVAESETATTSYWVRCLPPDFPPMQFELHPEAGTPPAGYYLLGNWFFKAGASGYATVLDRNGVPVWYAPMSSPTVGPADVDLLLPGVISYFPFDAFPTGPFLLTQLSPLKVSSIGPTTDPPTLHELQTLPNGDFLILSNPVIYDVDLTGLTVSVKGVPTALGPGMAIEDCMIVEFTPPATPVWSWRASQHFSPVKDTQQASTAFDGKPIEAGADGAVPLLVDVFHCNSIDVDPTNDAGLLVSGRDMDSFFYVDRVTNEVLWKAGGSQTKGIPYVTVDEPFYGQHDVRFGAGWSSTCNGGTGPITLFDDQTGGTLPGARGVVYQVVVGGPDGGAAGSGCADGGASDAGAPGTATRTLQFPGSGPSALAGSHRVLSGSHVIDWGIPVKMSSANLVFTEFDEAGHDLLDFSFTNGSHSYRTIRVPQGGLDLDTLRSSAGM